tara:strand:+ start:2113 stop:2292 length:180 start_codon:yes stop_codon:yes gene_type:complete
MDIEYTTLINNQINNENINTDVSELENDNLDKPKKETRKSQKQLFYMTLKNKKKNKSKY